jgi:hypothetical protein
MPLDEAEFTMLVDAGCTCGSKELHVEALVAQKLDLYRGDLYGSPSWGYKGEQLVQGTYRIECARCHAELYASEVCPLCESAGGVERALDAENEFAFVAACSECGGAQLTASAYVPARVSYGGARAQKARSNVAPEDPGFHAFRIECKVCRHATTAPRGTCVLCGTPKA